MNESRRAPGLPVVSIGRQGVYDLGRRVWYWADWMLKKRGAKVLVFSHALSQDLVQIFDSVSMEFLGEARVTKVVPRCTFPYVPRAVCCA